MLKGEGRVQEVGSGIFFFFFFNLFGKDVAWWQTSAGKERWWG